ncbi:MAG: F0F1 ATP synthase subunit B [Pseudomonadota bacterium]
MIALKGLKRKSAIIAGADLIYVLLLSSLSFAAGGGEGAGGGSAHLWDLLYRVINFGLLVIILFLVIKKVPIKDLFAKRREEIRRMLDDLKRDKEAAQSSYQELEKKLREFEIKKKEIIEQFRADGEAEKERIIAEAKERASQILAHADLTIEREVEGARDRLRQELVDLAADKAQDIIARNIKDSDQEHLVNEFIERVEKLH